MNFFPVCYYSHCNYLDSFLGRPSLSERLCCIPCWPLVLPPEVGILLLDNLCDQRNQFKVLDKKNVLTYNQVRDLFIPKTSERESYEPELIFHAKNWNLPRLLMARPRFHPVDNGTINEFFRTESRIQTYKLTVTNILDRYHWKYQTSNSTSMYLLTAYSYTQMQQSQIWHWVQNYESLSKHANEYVMFSMYLYLLTACST